MELSEISKGIIDREYEKIELIEKYIRDGAHRFEDPLTIDTTLKLYGDVCLKRY
jgi:hypothetical protein